MYALVFVGMVSPLKIQSFLFMSVMAFYGMMLYHADLVCHLQMLCGAHGLTALT